MTTPNLPCVPACKACREAGLCIKPAEPMRIEDLPRRRSRNPYADDCIEAPCGCMILPWPVVHQLGSDFEELLCDTHGWQKITKAWKKRAKKTTKVLATVYDANDPLPF